MDIINQSLKIKITPITPVYIGGASEKNWCNGLDYIFDEVNCKVYIINHQKIITLLKSPQLKDYTNALVNNTARAFIDNLSQENKITVDEIADHSFDLGFKPENDIKAHIRNGMGKPFIPGSSLKGAIRSVLFNKYFDEEQYLNFKTIPQNKRIQEDEYVFGSISNNLMQYFQISDVEFNNTELFTTKIFNLIGNDDLLEGGWKHSKRNNTNKYFHEEGFTTTYETLKLGEPGYGSLQINIRNADFSRKYSHQPPPNLEKLFENNPTETLFKLINDYSIMHINKELDFFRMYSNNETVSIVEKLIWLKNLAEKTSKGCILRIACGSGFHGITGDWQFKTHEITNIVNFNGRTRGQYKGRDSAKSRKIAFAEYEENDKLVFQPMGFVYMTLPKN
jgi:CRISPR/Cas system CSM-associated protein Csm5 (group 7 of RAMP superfamily)